MDKHGTIRIKLVVCTENAIDNQAQPAWGNAAYQNHKNDLTQTAPQESVCARLRERRRFGVRSAGKTGLDEKQREW